MDLGLIVTFGLLILVAYIAVVDFVGAFNPTPRRGKKTRQTQNEVVTSDDPRRDRKGRGL